MMRLPQDVRGAAPRSGLGRGFTLALPITSHVHARPGSLATCAHPVNARSRPESAQEQDQLNRSSSHPTLPVGSQEQLSTLQVLLDRSMHQHPRTSPERDGKAASDLQPQELPTHQPHRVHRHLMVAADKPAGHLAGRLAGILRVHSCSDVSVPSVLSIFKCLKVMALTNIFLSQHKSECSFVFAGVSQAEHQARVERMMNTNRHRNNLPPQQQHHLQPDPSPQPHNHQHSELSTSSGQPFPRLPPLFKLQAWATRSSAAVTSSSSNPLPNPNSPPSNPGIQMLDFSLDMRQMWKYRGHLSFDTAMSIADTLLLQLIAQLPNNTNPQSQQGYSAVSTASYLSPPHTGSAASQPAPGQPTISGRGKRVAAGRWEEDWDTAPAILCGTDLSQAVLMFAALSFVQQRLTEDNHSHTLVVTVTRHQNPRVDGRNGFLLKLQLQPITAVRHQLNRQRTYKRGQEQPQLTTPTQLA